MARTASSRHFGSLMAIDPVTGKATLEVFVTHARMSAVAPAHREEWSRLAPATDRCSGCFVNAERVAYNWRWIDEDPDKAGYPIDWETRFGRQVF